MTKTKHIVIVSNGWGAKYGGINAFNADFCKALGKVVGSEYSVICAVPEAEDSDRKELKTQGVELLPIEYRMEPPVANHIDQLISEEFAGEIAWWVGHDIYSGKVANFGAANVGGRSAVIHHMAYEYYSTAKSRDGHKTIDQDKEQRRIGNECDLMFGVGPLLNDHACNLKNQEKVFELIPGLADIKEASPHSGQFNTIVFGRVTKEDDIIKNCKKAAAAFGKVVGEISGISSVHPRLTVIGLPKDPDKYKQEFKQLDETASKAAERMVNVIPLSYSENRKELFEQLARHHVCMMLSWHEGFGLVGWEAIAATVPLILSKNSGLYHLLDKHPETLGLIWSVDIKNQPSDIETVAKKLRWIERNFPKAKKRARILKKKLLSYGYTWENCAKTFCRSCGIDVHETQAGIKKSESSPFKTAGALGPNAKSYVERDCDTELHSNLFSKKLIALTGEFETGKSSLLARSNKAPFFQDSKWHDCLIDFASYWQFENIKDFQKRFFGDISKIVNEDLKDFEALHSFLGHDSLLLRIDEFGKISQSPAIASFLIVNFHRIATETNDFRLIVSLPIEIRECIDSTDTPDFKNPKYKRNWHNIKIQPFESEQAITLLRLLPDNIFCVLQHQIAIIMKYSEGRSRVLQILCNRLWHARNNLIDPASIKDLVNNKSTYED